MVIIDNFYAALYHQAVEIGTVNPPGELNYKGYKRQLFCSYQGVAMENITFSKAETTDADSATHIVIMTGKGKVLYSNLLAHNKNND